jgi:hypothetical protein
MAKVVTLNPIDPFTFEYQDYSAQDDNLIVNFTIEPTFNPLQNYVAYFIYDLNNTVIFDSEVNFDGYNIIDNSKNSGRPDTFVSESLDNQFLEYQFTADNLDLFTGYTIKIVMAGTNQAYAPRFKDLRSIAIR